MLNFKGNLFLTSCTALLIFATLMAVLGVQLHLHLLPHGAFYFTIGWLFFAVVSVCLSARLFVGGFLCGLFGLLIAWRIVAIYGILLFDWFFVPTFLFMLLNFIQCMTQNIKNPARFRHAVSYGGWQLTFIRMYLGLDFIPHFTEKLFAGPTARAGDLQAFISLGIPYPDFFVFLAGLCELAAAISLSMGLMTRLGSLFAAFYLLVATYLGHHFSLGFIWVNHGGGWEFAVMWMLLVLSYAFSNARDFSLDQTLSDRFVLPWFLKKLM